MADITEIKNVPHSPGTSWDTTEIFNPLSEDFVWSFNGKPYTIPANSRKSFPEFLARHFAKHLARKIVYANAYKEIEEKAKGQLTPDTAKAVPGNRVEIMEAWILKPVGQSPEQNLGTPKVEEDKTDMKLEEQSGEQKKKDDERYQSRLVNIRKAQAARAAKRLEKSKGK